MKVWVRNFKRTGGNTTPMKKIKVVLIYSLGQLDISSWEA